jgi:hypothetical protein
VTNYHVSNVSDNERYRWVFDEQHQTIGSYGYDTEEETKAAEDEEIEKLNSGEWVVLGLIHERRCLACKQWEHIDSLWGIVVENDDTKLNPKDFM